MSIALPSRRVLGVVLVALALVLSWQLGRRHGLELGEARARAEAASAIAIGTAPVATFEVTAGSGAADAGEREMLRATVRSLRAALDEAGRLSAAERDELELYRRIGADGAPDGVAIDTLGRRGEDPATLYLTLVQARGRERVAGTVELVRLDADVGASPADESGGPRATLGDGPAATWSAPFDLRFFETLEIPLDEAVPELVEIRIVPTEGPHAPFRQRFRRDDMRILD